MGEIWLFDDAALELGDIVLERGNGVGSAVVAGATLGRYSHALIWVGADFVEAMPSGTRNLSFVRVPIQVRKNWLLLRPLPAFEEVGARAALEARGLVQKDYDLQGALRSVVLPRPTAKPSASFCSQLISEAYQRAGLDLIPGKRCEQITPNMLAKSKHLRSVRLPLRRAEDAMGRPFPTELLDRNAAYRSSPMNREAEISKAAYRAIERLLSDWPASVPKPGSAIEVIDWLPSTTSPFRDIVADRLCDELAERGYFDLLPPALMQIYPRISATKYWQDLSASWIQTQRRFHANALTCADISAHWPHRLYTRLGAMHAQNASALAVMIAKARGEPAGGGPFGW